MYYYFGLVTFADFSYQLLQQRNIKLYRPLCEMVIAECLHNLQVKYVKKAK